MSKPALMPTTTSKSLVTVESFPEAKLTQEWS